MLNLIIDRIIRYHRDRIYKQVTKRSDKKMLVQSEINDIFEASRQIKAGVFFTGNLDEILDQRKKS